MKIFLIILIAFSIQVNAHATNRAGRLGVGLSDQLVTGMKTVSIKLQRTRASGFGGILGLDSSEDGTYYAVGLRYYRLIFEEPQLTFYTVFAGNLLNYENEDNDNETGYQFDALLGSEFSFQGVESIGFSFEFGATLYNLDDKTHIATSAQNILKAAVHFYL